MVFRDESSSPSVVEIHGLDDGFRASVVFDLSESAGGIDNDLGRSSLKDVAGELNVATIRS